MEPESANLKRLWKEIERIKQDLKNKKDDSIINLDSSSEDDDTHEELKEKLNKLQTEYAEAQETIILLKASYATNKLQIQYAEALEKIELLQAKNDTLMNLLSHGKK